MLLKNVHKSKRKKLLFFCTSMCTMLRCPTDLTVGTLRSIVKGVAING